MVSIHAPARGATRQEEIVGTGLNGFNPRTRTGCDDRLDPLILEIMLPKILVL